jgi:hypothetical protein
MMQMAEVDRLTVNSVVGARTGAIAWVEADSDGVAVATYDRRIKFPVQAREAVEFALSHPRFAVRELPALDDAGKLTIVRRLIREGLVVALDLA